MIKNIKTSYCNSNFRQKFKIECEGEKEPYSKHSKDCIDGSVI